MQQGVNKFTACQKISPGLCSLLTAVLSLMLGITHSQCLQPSLQQASPQLVC